MPYLCCKFFFFLLFYYSQSCLWFGSANQVVKILSVADWLGVTPPGHMIFRGLTVLQSLWLPKFFAELRETEWHWWDPTRYHNTKPRGIIKDSANVSYFHFFKPHFLRSEMSLYLFWNRNNTVTPKLKIFPWSRCPRVLLIIIILEKIPETVKNVLSGSLFFFFRWLLITCAVTKPLVKRTCRWETIYSWQL